MGANAIIDSTNGVDLRGERLRPFFGPFPGDTDAYWYCSKIDDGIGSDPPGTAEIVISNNPGVVDEAAYAVALNPDGPMSSIKHDTDVRIWRDYYVGGNADANNRAVLAFSGKVEKLRHVANGTQDRIIVSCVNAIGELRKVRIKGIFVCDGSSVYYREGMRAHFNPGGRPNCIFDSSGRPWFAPYPDYGIDTTTDENPAAASDKSVSVACYWTLGLILTYLRNTTGPNGLPSDGSCAGLAAQVAFFPGYSKCPTWLIWAESFGSGLDTEAIANFDNGVGQNNTYLSSTRKGRDIDLTGMYLAGGKGVEGVFDLLFRTSGGWSWRLQYDNVDANGLVTNTLITTENRYTSSPMVLGYAAGGQAKDVMNGATITQVDLEESSENTVTRAIGGGGLVKVETRVASAVTNGPFAGGSGPLIPAWTAARHELFRALVVTLGGDAYAFTQALGMFPDVMTIWEVNPSYNFMAGTDFASYPRAPITRPIWPYLLSFQGSKNGPRDSNIKPYPVYVETDPSGAGTAWNVAQSMPSFEAWANGIIYLPQLREMAADPTQRCWRWNSGSDSAFGVSGGKIDIAVNDIRMNLAIPCDHRLSYAVRTLMDTSALGSSSSNFFETIENSPDADRFESTFQRALILELNQLYDLWFRVGSFPEPESAGGATFIDRANLSHALRNDLSMMSPHVRRGLRDNFRLSRNGTVTYDGYFVTELQPGQSVSYFVPNPIGSKSSFPFRAVFGRRRMICDQTIVDGVPTFKNRTEFTPI